MQSMTLLHTLTHPSRVHDIKFYRPVNVDGEPEFLLVAAEDKKVTVYQILTTADAPPRVIAELVGHTNRRAIHLHHVIRRVSHSSAE
jgi:protein MAK11